MALYVSDSINLYIKIRAEENEFTPKGDLIRVRPRLVAQFDRGACPDWALDEAISRLAFRGKEDGLPYQARTGVFDTMLAQQTYGWTDEDREHVEDFMDKCQGPGSNFIRPEIARLAAPWPNIENHRPGRGRSAEASFEKVAELAESFGVDLVHVAAYTDQEGWPADVGNLLREKHRALESKQETEEIVAA